MSKPPPPRDLNTKYSVQKALCRTVDWAFETAKKDYSTGAFTSGENRLRQALESWVTRGEIRQYNVYAAIQKRDGVIHNIEVTATIVGNHQMRPWHYTINTGTDIGGRVQKIKDIKKLKDNELTEFAQEILGLKHGR